jgi:branched-chain amino acid transport system substrate-binding protein
VIVKDDQGDETITRTAVGELLRENVVAVIGPSTSGPSMAVAPMCEEEKVPLVSCAALAKIVEGRTWVFKTPQRDDHVVERIYDYIKEKGMKKIALISSTDAFGAGGRATLVAKAPEYGLEIVADETYKPSDTDMTAQLTKIKAANPDAIVNWTIVPAQSIMMKNAKQLGIETQLFQSHGFGNYQYLAAAGDAAEGVIFPAGRILVAEDLPDANPQKALLVDLKKKYEAKYNDKMSTFAGHAYDALELVLEACEKKGATRQDIRDYIEARQGFVGTGGVFNFSPTDHTGLQKDALEMITVKDGKFTLLAK